IFSTTLDSVYGIPGWVIGMALLITPYFGFETVPQMVEEGDFPIKNSKKAICGSILTCGSIYVFYYFCVAGLDGLQDVYTNFAQDGFLPISTMQNQLGWTFWPIVVGRCPACWAWALLCWASGCPPFVCSTPWPT